MRVDRVRFTMSRRRIQFAGFLIAAGFMCAVAGARADSEALRLFGEEPGIKYPGRFTFVRIEYDSEGGYNKSFYDYDGRTWLRWETDYPEADQNFLYRLNELTVLNPNPQSESMRLTDPHLNDHPLIYMCDVGWMDLSKDEIKALREYLTLGGFLWVDDFWGDAEWETLERTMEDVLPEIPWKLIDADHPILNIVFQLAECPQIPARDFAEVGYSYDPPNIHRQPAGGDRGVNTVNFRGWFAEDGTLMAIATHNTDIGDGWEREAEGELFFEKYSTRAYALGINVIVYALTH